jgi:hypothetical protein
MLNVCARRSRSSVRVLAFTSAAVLIAALALHQTAVAGQGRHAKLSTVLADLAGSVAQEQGRVAAQGGGRSLSLDAVSPSVQDAVRGGWLRIDQQGAVQVYVLVSEVNDQTLAQLTSAGATIEIADAARRRVQARVPASRLDAVAALTAVDAVRLPTYARHRSGVATSEGDAILHADAVRQLFGVDGTGVRVGVASDGLKGVFASGCTTSCSGVDGGPMGTGDLPSATGVRNSSGVLTSATGSIIARSFRANGDLEGLPPASCGFAGAGAEGTAMLEIIHDLAPGAKLSFANGDTDLEFIQAVNFLAASNDVVLDDAGFYGEPYDGTSAVSRNTAAALNNASFPLRAYFTSVGNDADAHYYDTYTDSRIDGTTVSGIPSIGHMHLFQRTAETTDALGLGSQTYNVLSLPQNGEVALFLTWDDPFGASGNNYDLYLVQQSTGRVVASSRDVQAGRQDPVEFIDYVNRGSQDTFRIVIQNVQDAAQPRHLNLFAFAPECAAGGPQLLAPPRHERLNYNTSSHSVAAQSDAGGSPVSVVAVGAICSASAAAAAQFTGAPNESCNDTSNSTIEYYSSRGPTLDGRVKPDVTAIDAVTVTGAGKFTNPFFGTSAAVAHLGGIAALALQSAPCLLGRSTSTVDAPAARERLRRLFLDNTFASTGTAPNNTFGFGRADALTAVQKVVPNRTGPTTLVVDADSPLGAALTPLQLGFADPNQCSLTSLSWTGGCGSSPGTTMTCPFGASSVSVAASNNGLTFSEMSDLNITVTDFSMDVTPAAATLSAGSSATLVVTLTPQGGPYRREIALTCNTGALPAGMSCSFNPQTVTVGTAAVRSILTLSTTATSLVLPPDATGRSIDPLPRRRPAVPPALLLLSTAIAVGAWTLRRLRPYRPAVVAAALLVAFAVSGRTPARAAVSPLASGIALFPSTLTFGSQTVSTTAPAQVVRVTNIGSDPLTLVIGASGDFSSVTSCGSSLPSGDSCAVAVSFTPTATGSRTGTLTFSDNAEGSPHTVALAGTGAAAPAAGSGTPTGSYTVTVTATAGTLTHTAPLTIGVQ